MKIDKPKIAIVNLSSCSGCQVEIVNLGNKFLDLLEFIEIGNFPLIEERAELRQSKKTKKPYDLTFVEGLPITKEEIKYLKNLRKRTKFLAALGTCAWMSRMKDIVKIDFQLTGCPINKDEFYQAICEFLNGKLLKISQRPVCYECQIKEYQCLLQKNLPCLGPITLAGCQAICLKNNFPCQGCRGSFEEADLKKMEKFLKKKGFKKFDISFKIPGNLSL